MGRNAKANREQREAARGRLLGAAMRLFARHGVDRTSVAQVAAAAGVSKGLVYHYFETKDALVTAVLEERVRRVSARFEAPDGVTDARRLREFATSMVEAVRRDPEGYRLLLGALAHPEGGDALRRAILARSEDIQARAREAASLFARLGADDPLLEARFFQATLVGILVLEATSPIDHAPERLVERLLSAVSAQEV